MKRTLSVGLFILFTASTSLMCQIQLEKANDLVKSNMFTEAIDVYRAHLQTNPKDENTWLLLAKAFQKAGMLDSAEIAAKKVVQLDDEMLDAYVVLSQIQLERKNAQEASLTAETGLKTIPKKQPKYAPLLVALGQALIALDSADAALIVASQAKELDSKNIGAYEVMGDAYAKQKVAPMAINSYEKSLEIDSVQPRVLYKLANTYTKERQYTPAAQVYTKILNLDPGNDAARLELAGLLFRAKQYARCAKVLEEYVKKEKNLSKDVQLMYLEALLRGRLYQEAFQMGLQILKTDPNSSLALRAVANGYFNNKQFAKAIETFQKAITIDTMDFEDYRWYGASYKQLKKDSLAAQIWEEGLQRDSTISLTMRSFYIDQIASTWMGLRSYDRAAKYYEERIKLDSSAVGAYINYAQCMMQLERFKGAVSALKIAIEKNPNIPTAYTSLGFCYFQMKDFDAGSEQFRTAIKVADTSEWRYRIDLADSYRMLALAVMIEKKSTEEESMKKWQDAISYLKKSLKYKEDVAQTHLNLGKCYQNLNTLDLTNSNWKTLAIKEYKRTLQLDPRNEDAKKALNDLQ
jgi:tetratricopeptide (TPR) repeat protein